MLRGNNSPRQAKKTIIRPVLVAIWIFINSFTTAIALPIRKAEYTPATASGMAKNTAVRTKSHAKQQE